MREHRLSEGGAARIAPKTVVPLAVVEPAHHPPALAMGQPSAIQRGTRPRPHPAAAAVGFTRRVLLTSLSSAMLITGTGHGCTVIVHAQLPAGSRPSGAPPGWPGSVGGRSVSRSGKYSPGAATRGSSAALTARPPRTRPRNPHGPGPRPSGGPPRTPGSPARCAQCYGRRHGRRRRKGAAPAAWPPPQPSAPGSPQRTQHEPATPPPPADPGHAAPAAIWSPSHQRSAPATTPPALQQAHPALVALVEVHRPHDSESVQPARLMRPVDTPGPPGTLLDLLPLGLKLGLDIAEPPRQLVNHARPVPRVSSAACRSSSSYGASSPIRPRRTGEHLLQRPASIRRRPVSQDETGEPCRRRLRRLLAGH